jgi:glycosyltransferase involved in cell wall biosynthesis
MLATVPAAVIRVFAPVVHALADADAMVMNNGSGKADEYLLDLARLAGVRVQLVDLGSKGPTEIPVRGSVTAYIAPSHFVMHDPTTVQAVAAVKAEARRWRRALCLERAGLVVDAAAEAKGGWEGARDEESMEVDEEECDIAAAEVPDDALEVHVDVLHPALDWEKFGSKLDPHITPANPNSDELAEQPPLPECPSLADTFTRSDPAEVVVMFVARLASQKGVGMFVRMAAMLLKGASAGGTGAGVKYKFVMVGGGPMKEHMEQLAARLMRSNSVIFPGFVPQHELPCWLRFAHIFVFPVLYPESFGLSPVEAMVTAGIPVVHFGVGGSGEYARHEREGLVADEISAAGLARAVARLAHDPQLRKELGGRARSAVRELYGGQRAVARFGATMQLLCGRAARGA